jgi:protein required for attachment to host cells
MLRIPYNGFVFVGDGTKALVLRNEGDAQILNLKTERVFTDANPPRSGDGSSGPGLLVSRRGSFQRNPN